MKQKHDKNTICRLLLLAMISIMLLGCNQGNTGTNALTLDKLRTGTDGITIEFIDKQIPGELYETASDDTDKSYKINLGLNIKNLGAYDAKELYFSIKGDAETELENNPDIQTTGSSNIDSSISKNVLTFSTEELKGKSLENPVGELFYANIPIKIGTLPGLLHKENTFFTNVCYKYQTIASPTICIDPNIYNPNPDEKKSCTMEEISLSSQGAPVAVTSVNPISYTDKIVLDIKIANKGDGEIVNINDYPENLKELCVDGTFEKKDKDLYNIVGIEVKMGDKPYCSETTIKIKNGQGNARCTIDDIQDTKSAYSTPIEIILKYGYKEVGSKKITIKSLGQTS